MFVNKYFTFEPQQAFLLWLTILAHQATGKVHPQSHSVKPSESVQGFESFLFVNHNSYSLIRFNIPVGCVVQYQCREQHLDVIYFATRAGVGLHGLQVLHAVARLLQ